jgi:ferric-dicitrate binding protein FerR (iron transport regulator)
MSTNYRIRMGFVGVLGCLLLLSPRAQAVGGAPLGRVLYSYGTTLGVVSGAKPETIFSDDVLTTTADGSAMVELDSGAKVKITENTSVRFLRDEKRILVELKTGAVVAETSSSTTLVVRTPKYRFESARLGDCRYLVRLSTDQVTTAAAIKGNVLVRSNQASGSYLLHEAAYAVIDADASGIPSESGQTASKTQIYPGPGRHGAWRIGSLSERASIALEVGIAAGAAAAVAIPLSKSSPVSPSEP